MASLDGYSLNKKVDEIREELKAELLKLRIEFTELYAYMKKVNTIKEEATKVVKAPAKKKIEKKVLEVTESVG